MVLIDSSHEDQARRLQEDEWWRLGEMRTIAFRLRARILGLRCLADLAGFSELNPQFARDVRQTALAGPPCCMTGTRKMLALLSAADGAVLGRPGAVRQPAMTDDGQR
jgi:hypothetical protein